MMLQLWIYVKVSIGRGNEGCKPLPTRPQRYCNSWLLVQFSFVSFCCCSSSLVVVCAVVVVLVLFALIRSVWDDFSADWRIRSDLKKKNLEREILAKIIEDCSSIKKMFFFTSGSQIAVKELFFSPSSRSHYNFFAIFRRRITIFWRWKIRQQVRTHVK